MPSANLQAEKLAEKPNDLDYVNQPMKPAMTIVEHKIRNLEKRKVGVIQCIKGTLVRDWV